MIPDTDTIWYLVLKLDTDTWIGTGFLTSRALQSCVTTTQMYLALRAMVTNIQLIRRQLLLRIIFETGFINAYRVCAHAQRNVSLWQLYQLYFWMMNTLCVLRRSRAGSKWSQTGSQRLRTERRVLLKQYDVDHFHIKSKTAYWELRWCRSFPSITHTAICLIISNPLSSSIFNSSCAHYATQPPSYPTCYPQCRDESSSNKCTLTILLP